MEQTQAVAFGPYVLDPSERRLARDGEPVPLSPRLLALLLALVERPGHLISKDALLSTVWSDVLVEENVLTVAISRLRAVLGAEGTYIETVPGHGYRFTAPVGPVPPPDAARPYPARLVPRNALRPREVVRRPVLLAATGALTVAVALGALASRHVVEAAVEDQASTHVLSPPASGHEILPPDPNWSAEEAVAHGERLLAMRRSLPEALVAFERAIELDPTSSRAFLGVAQYHAMGSDPLPAEAALGRALALDPESGEAYATLGFVLGMQRWDWKGARIAFERALHFAPEHSRTHQWHAVFLMVHRQLEEAEAAASRALALDPTSANLHSDLCEIRLARRNFAGARLACERALTFDPSFHFARQHLFWINLLEHSPAEAAQWAHKAQVLMPRGARFTGNAEVWLEATAQALARSAPSVPYDAYTLARIQAVRGHTAAAVDALALAVQSREFHVPFANADPTFDPLRDDPRFRALMRQVGLPDQ